nr:cysteine-rich venom protein 6-like [Onthophagus taurus]
MVSQIAVFALTLAVVVVAQDNCGPPQCGPNQVYKCGSPCKDFCNRTPIICEGDCVYGCYCEDGYTFENYQSNTCVPEAQCRECPETQVFSDCGSACPDYCGKPDDIMCIQVCVPRCVCEPGLIFSGNGSQICIPESEC